MNTILPSPAHDQPSVEAFHLMLITTGLKQLYKVNGVTGFYEYGLPFNNEDKEDFIKYFQNVSSLIVNSAALAWVQAFDCFLEQLFEADANIIDPDKYRVYVKSLTNETKEKLAPIHKVIQENCNILESEMEIEYGI